MYLPAEVVRALADDLFSHNPLEYVNRWWGKRLKQGGAKYQFAPEEATRFFAAHGWRELEFHALFEESIRLRCTMRGMWIFKIMKQIAPRRTARMLEKWRAGVALLGRSG